MGERFTFIRNQYYLVVGSRDLYIDLLLFHRSLRRLIAIELEIGKFKVEYAVVSDGIERVKLPDENQSMGIMLCKSKDKSLCGVYVEAA